MQIAVISNDIEYILGNDLLTRIFVETRVGILPHVGKVHGKKYLAMASKMTLDKEYNHWFFDGYFFDAELRHAYKSDWERINFQSITASDLGGVFTIAKLGPSNFRIETDPLGQYTLFYWRSGRSFIVSNNIHLVKALIERIGISTKPSALNVLMNIAHMTAFSTVSPLDPVRMLRPRHSLHLGEGGSFIETESVTVGQLTAPKDATYDAAIDRVATRLGEHGKQLAHFSRDHAMHAICDLSGGIDSRMVLGCFLKSQSEQHVRFFSTTSKEGDAPTKDRIVSDFLAQQFNLKNGPALWDSRNSSKDYTIAAKTLSGSHRYFGAVSVVFEDYGDVYVGNYGRFGGYCGEHTRSFGPSGVTDFSYSNISEQFIDYYSKRGHGVLTAEGMSAIKAVFQPYILELLQKIDPKLAFTLAYVENRSKFHFGTRQQIGNMFRACMTTLADPEILSLHTYLPYLHIEKNRIARDLLIAFAGKKLADAPRAHGWWPAIFFDDDGEYQSYDRGRFKDEIARAEPISPLRSYGTIRIKGAPGKVDTEFDRSFLDLSRHKSTPSSYRTYLELIRYAVEWIKPDDELWTLLNREAILRLGETTTNWSDEGTQQRTMRIASALLFYAGLTKADPPTLEASISD